MLKALLCLTLASFVTSTAWSKSDKEVNEEALKNTQDLLKNPTERQKALNTPAARQSVEQLKNLTGGDAQIEQEIWELSADLMPILLEESKGDPQKMTKLLQEMKANPLSFADKFSGAQKEKLRKIAEKIASKQKP